jgi:hypothetical protein
LRLTSVSGSRTKPEPEGTRRKYDRETARRSPRDSAGGFSVEKFQVAEAKASPFPVLETEISASDRGSILSPGTTSWLRRPVYRSGANAKVSESAPARTSTVSPAHW